MMESKPTNITVVVNRTVGNVKTAQVTSMGLLVQDQAYFIDCDGQFSQYAQILRPWLEDKEIMVSVSYTHLDVYKRQPVR